MEKKIRDLLVLEKFKNRQVILNRYIDEDYLLTRDGFYFFSLKLSDGNLLFTKKNASCCVISIKDFPEMYVDNQFPNYFILRNGTERLEIYFP